MDEDRLSLLLEREMKYRCYDYLGVSGHHLQGLSVRTTANSPPSSSSSSSLPRPSPPSSSTAVIVDETWRELICGWSYKMVDSYNWSRSIVFISMNFLDRYVGKGKVRSSITYQLAALTSFYLATKINLPSSCKALGRDSSSKLQMSTLIMLSRGKFTQDDFLRMELDILQSLEWYLWPPAPLTFIQCFIHLLPVVDHERDKYHLSLNNTTKKEINEFARYLSELSCYDYFFVTKDPSLIALSCLLNALSIVLGETLSLPSSQFFSSQLFYAFQREILAVANIDILSDDVQECSSRLEGIYLYNKEQSSKDDNTELTETGSCISNESQHLVTSPKITRNKHGYKNKSIKFGETR